MFFSLLPNKTATTAPITTNIKIPLTKTFPPSDPLKTRSRITGQNPVIINKKTIRVMNYDNVPIAEFKPYVDKIAQYLIDEGYVTELIPRVEVVVPKG